MKSKFDSIIKVELILAKKRDWREISLRMAEECPEA